MSKDKLERALDKYEKIKKDDDPWTMQEFNKRVA